MHQKTSDKRSQNSPLKWQDPVEKVPGLGPNRARFLEKQEFFTIGDLLYRAPLRFIDRRKSPPFNQLEGMHGAEITAIGTVESSGETGKRYKNRRLIVIIGDGSGGYIQGVWFSKFHYLKPKFKKGSTVAFTGKLTFYDGFQITHPQVTFLDAENSLDPGVGLFAVYPSGDEWEKIGLGRRKWSDIIRFVIGHWDGSGPYIPEPVQRMEKLLTFKEAISGLHQPATTDEFDSAVHSLKFAELFQHQLLLVALRRRRRQKQGIVIGEKEKRYLDFISRLPFKLAEGQKNVIREISDDLRSGVPMYRLLQGEVGAGKTVVAFAAAGMTADSGYQTAIMAPTELLARQHYQNALEWFDETGIKLVLLTGGRHPREHERALFEASSGGADIIIGTHALFQERVRLHRLGLVVIDEQQRFGVQQRAELVGKGGRPHVLLMTATPIPRTLALTHYGDLDISYLPTLPGMVRKVTTRIVNEGSRDKVFSWLRDKLHRGAAGYLIFPVIDQGINGLEAAQARFEPYQKIDFKDIPIALIHGRQPVEERIKAMEDFRSGNVRLLMATAVVEVGVDVPQASLMVIENSERFGLAQLHQLRGRIGRDGSRAFCILMTSERQDQPGFSRLQKLETSDNGLTLAEEDMQLRGSGEPLGARQSGMARFQIADLSTDREILKRANLCAHWVMDNTPDLAPYPELRKKLREDYRNRPRTLQAG